MPSLVLIVEDNPDVLTNIKMTLEFNNYETITAINGKKGLVALSEVDKLPDLIISDIMMPEMNGYDFFKAVSQNPDWSQIPFLFLTARADPEDIRFGKMLGIDDYLTKPYKEKDLLATITGKISRTKSMRKKIEELISRYQGEVGPSLSEKEKESVILLHMIGDPAHEPTLDAFMARELDPDLSVEELGKQLYQSVDAVYGTAGITQSQGVLLRMENINRHGYAYFSFTTGDSPEDRKNNFMLAVIAPRISYFDSLYLKGILGRIAIQIKAGKPWEIKEDWRQISEILALPIM